MLSLNDQNNQYFWGQVETRKAVIPLRYNDFTGDAVNKYYKKEKTNNLMLRYEILTVELN